MLVNTSNINVVKMWRLSKIAIIISQTLVTTTGIDLSM